MNHGTPTSPRIGVRFEPDWPPEELPQFARWAEEAGYEELWFSEDLPWAGGAAMAATALACTEKIHVGVGLLPAATRNVATTAMEIGALARIAPGRVTMVIGHGVPAWMEQIGARTSAPLAVLEETVSALRGLLAGETLTMVGTHFELNEVALGFPPEVVPPILVGTTGARGLELAGRCSDGVLLPELASPNAIRWAREEMRRTGDPGTTAMFAMLSVKPDRESAIDQTRSRIQRLVDFQIFPRLMETAGLGSDGAGEMTDEILQSLAATGSPEDCQKAVERWIAAGADRIVFVGGDFDSRKSYEAFASEVLPKLRTVA